MPRGIHRLGGSLWLSLLVPLVAQAPAAATTLLVQGSLTLREPGATETGRSNNWIDLRRDHRLAYRSRNRTLQLRERDGTWCAAGQTSLPGGLHLLAGRVDLAWGAGCLLTGAWDTGLEGLSRGGARAELPLRARPTTAWTEQPQQGAALIWNDRQTALAIWTLKERQGLALRQGVLALALMHRGIQARAGWSWSGVLSWPPAGRRFPQASDGLQLEVAGSCGPLAPRDGDPGRDGSVLVSEPPRRQGIRSIHALGGHWHVGSLAGLGGIAGAFRTYRRDQHAVPGASSGSLPDEGWAVRWTPPPRAGWSPEIEASSRRIVDRTRAVPTLERDLRIVVNAQPRTGLQLRGTYGQRRTLACRGEPRALVTAWRSVLDLRAAIRLSPWVNWVIRCRSVSGELSLADEDRPRGILSLLEADGALLEENETPGGEAHVVRRWRHGSGGLLSAALRWRTHRDWQGGVTLAVAPSDGVGRSAVSIRLPPGRHLWQALGAGCWLLELWAGRAGVRGRLESAVRFMTQDGEVGLVLVCGYRRSIPL